MESSNFDILVARRLAVAELELARAAEDMAVLKAYAKGLISAIDTGCTPEQLKLLIYAGVPKALIESA